jgi:hypothetical protein
MRGTTWLVTGMIAMVALGACGGGDSAGPSGGSGFSAKVDGVAWDPEPLGIVAQAVPGVPGALLLTGAQSISGGSFGLTITLYNISGPGTYPLGVSSEVFGGIGQVGQLGNSWITENTGNEGSVTITKLTANRIVGTFAYTAEPGQNNSVGGTRVVTDGHFDLPFTGTLVPVPDNVGSSVTASLGDQSYTAWSVNGLLQDNLGGAGFQFSSTTKEHGLSVLISGAITPGAVFTLSNTGPARLIGAGRNGGNADHCCWGGGSTGLDVGTITITSVSADRVQGTLTATLQPVSGKPATQPLVITDAEFNVAIP